MTYEEYVARSMLLGGVYYPAYHCYNLAHRDLDDNRWLDADTLEDLHLNGVLTKRYKLFVKKFGNGTKEDRGHPTDPKFFKWCDFTMEGNN